MFRMLRACGADALVVVVLPFRVGLRVFLGVLPSDICGMGMRLRSSISAASMRLRCSSVSGAASEPSSWRASCSSSCRAGIVSWYSLSACGFRGPEEIFDLRLVLRDVLRPSVRLRLGGIGDVHRAVSEVVDLLIGEHVDELVGVFLVQAQLARRCPHTSACCWRACWCASSSRMLRCAAACAADSPPTASAVRLRCLRTAAAAEAIARSPSRPAADRAPNVPLMANAAFIARLFELGDARVERARRLGDLSAWARSSRAARQIDGAGAEGDGGDGQTQSGCFHCCLLPGPDRGGSRRAATYGPSSQQLTCRGAMTFTARSRSRPRTKWGVDPI